MDANIGKISRGLDLEKLSEKQLVYYVAVALEDAAGALYEYSLH